MWSEKTISAARAFFSNQEDTNERLVRYARAMKEHQEPQDLAFLLRSYAEGQCSYIDHYYFKLRELIDDVGRDCGFVDPQQTLFDDRMCIKRDIMSLFCPDLLSELFEPRSNAELEAITLLEPSENELVDESFPAPMNMLLGQRTRPAMRAYTTRDAVVYVDPFRYQALSKDRSALWASGSPRSLPRRQIDNAEPISITKNIVVLTDRFTSSNFCHFLFDGITRAVLLHERLGSLRDCALIFNGIPHQFHDLVCTALGRVLDVEVDDIFFPDRAMALETSGRCIWFSDQVEGYTHPAQMAHPRSIGLLRSITQALPGEPTEYKRLYVSRGDARTRRIVNDQALQGALGAMGFHAVELKDLPVAVQTGLFRGAEIIVGAHGMGLTHVAACERLNGVVELFHPTAGTDAYAFVTKALGADYHVAVGRAADSDVSDFEVDIASITRAVEEIESRHAIERRRSSLPSLSTDNRTSEQGAMERLGGTYTFFGFAENVDAIVAPAVKPREQQGVTLDVSGPAWNSGCQSAPAVMASEVAPPFAGATVIKHLRDPAARESDTNVDWWQLRDLRGERSYTFSCCVYLPASSAASEVWLRLGLPLEKSVHADWSLRDQWQRVSLTVTLAADLPELAVVLCVGGDAGGIVFSSLWQVAGADLQAAVSGNTRLTGAGTIAHGDLPASELMLRFESLGENCEFGLVQRRCGAEPLGLFRFANAPLAPLVASLAARFDGLGLPDAVEVFVSERQEYMVRDRRFGFLYHAWVKPDEMTAEAVRDREVRRLPLLIRKLLEDLSAADKIFVYHGMDALTEPQIAPLLSVLRGYGPNTLLWVEQSDSAHPPGSVEWAGPGLLRGYIDRFAPGDDAHDLSLDSWMAICRAAHHLWAQSRR